MKKFGDILRSGDWKNEKHVPVISAPESAAADEPLDISVEVGADIPHPNTTEHHIRWIKLVFQPADGFAYELGDVQFTAHGEAVKGANEGPAYTEPKGTFKVRRKGSGTLLAQSYCNIHGLWEDSKAISVQ